MKPTVLWMFSVLLYSGVAAAEEPMSVQAALDYQLPENTCSKPDFIADGTVSSAPIQDSSGVPFFQGSSTATLSDVDSYERKRQARKERRWKKCLAKYKAGLLADMERLKSSAQHGLTETQAHAIVQHLVVIQEVYLSL